MWQLLDAINHMFSYNNIAPGSITLLAALVGPIQLSEEIPLYNFKIPKFKNGRTKSIIHVNYNLSK